MYQLFLQQKFLIIAVDITVSNTYRFYLKKLWHIDNSLLSEAGIDLIQSSAMTGIKVRL